MHRLILTFALAVCLACGLGADAQRTELFGTQQPGGAVVIVNNMQSTGARWFVDSGHTNATDSASFGRNPDKPFATLDFAIGNATASNGDIIVVMPGHTETVAAAAGVDFDMAGLTVIGQGSGSARPTFTFSAAASTIHVDAADTHIENIICQVGAGFDNTIMIDVDESGCTLKNIEFQSRTAATAREWVTAIDVDGGTGNDCDGLTIDGCVFDSPTSGASNCIGLDEVADLVTIKNCVMFGGFSDAAVHNPTGSILTNLNIRDNVITNTDTGDLAIELVSACTGTIVGNRMYGDTLGTILDPGALFCNDNLETDAVDQAGVTSPRTSAGGLPADSITATSIAADAFTNAKFADDVLSEEQFDDDAATLVTYGMVINRATDTLPATTTEDIATIAGGRVILTGIVGEVTTQIANATTNLKLIGTPTVGTALDICANLDIDQDEVGTLYGITGLFTDAMLTNVAGATVMPRNGVVLNAGTLAIETGATGAGAIKWTITWLPLDTGATMVTIAP